MPAPTPADILTAYRDMEWLMENATSPSFPADWELRYNSLQSWDVDSLSTYYNQHLVEGASILASRPLTTHLADSYLEVILAYIPANAEYVTWLFNRVAGGYTGGHYFEKLSAAAVDFEERR